MRFTGRLKTWTDDRGFGFIEPLKGGDEVFVHIKAFTRRDGRPQVDQLLSFEVELGPGGKKRARNVEPVRAPLRTAPSKRESPAQWGVASLFAIPAFMVLYVVVSVAWSVPRWAALAYLVLSGICFAAYAIDKSAAGRGHRRTSEQALLTLGLIGGWPGAIVAQQALRHKSSKTAFRARFWPTVVLNVVAFVGLSSPLVRLAAP